MSSAIERTPKEQLNQMMIPLDDIAESNLNHRKHFDEEQLRELAASMKVHGLLQPVMVRRAPSTKGKPFELVYGHRRFRAAKLAGLKELRADVADLDDVQVIEVQLIENCRRQDIKPMEEAEAFRQLRDEYKRTVEQIAEQLGKGKSKEYVYGRIKLTELKSPAARQYLDDGLITASHALLIARIPTEKLQEKAIEEIVVDHYDYLAQKTEKKAQSFRAAAAHIQSKYMLKLSEAPFDTKDAQLVPEAGPCTTCPFRTGNCRDLVPETEVKSDDVCTSPDCFLKKKAAAIKAVKAEAKEEGFEHLGQVPSLLDTYGGGNRLSYKFAEKYVELKEKCESDPKKRTFKQLLGDKAPVVLALDAKGAEHKLVRKEELNKLLTDAGHKFKVDVKDRSGGTRDWEAEEAKRKAKTERLKAISAAALKEVAPKVAALEETEFLRLLLPLVADDDLAKFRHFASWKDVANLASKMEGAYLRQLVFEGAIISKGAFDVWNGVNADLADVCKAHGVDVKKVEKTIDAAAKEAEKAKTQTACQVARQTKTHNEKKCAWEFCPNAAMSAPIVDAAPKKKTKARKEKRS